MATGLAARLKKAAVENGIDDRYPLLNKHLGRYTVLFDGSKMNDDGDCLMVTAVVVESDNDAVKEGSTIQILRKLGGKKGQAEARERDFNAFVVRAFGYADVAKINDEIEDWAEQVVDTDSPSFLGRVGRCEVIDTGRVTGDGVPIYKDLWSPSEAAPEE